MGFLGENNFCSVGYFVILGVCFKDENLVLAPGFAGQGEGNYIALFSGVDRNSVDMQVFTPFTPLPQFMPSFSLSLPPSPHPFVSLSCSLFCARVLNSF